MKPIEYMLFSTKVEELLKDKKNSDKLKMFGFCINWIISESEDPQKVLDEFIKKLQEMPLI